MFSTWNSKSSIIGSHVQLYSNTEWVGNPSYFPSCWAYHITASQFKSNVVNVKTKGLHLLKDVSYFLDMKGISGPPRMTKPTVASLFQSFFSSTFLYFSSLIAHLIYFLVPHLYISLPGPCHYSFLATDFYTFWPRSLYILGRSVSYILTPVITHPWPSFFTFQPLSLCNILGPYWLFWAPNYLFCHTLLLPHNYNLLAPNVYHFYSPFVVCFNLSGLKFYHFLAPNMAQLISVFTYYMFCLFWPHILVIFNIPYTTYWIDFYHLLPIWTFAVNLTKCTWF